MEKEPPFCPHSARIAETFANDVAAVVKGVGNMTGPSPRSVLLQLNENDRLGPVAVDAENFERFEVEFEERLSRLVDDWKHMAAPNAQRIRRAVRTK